MAADHSEFVELAQELILADGSQVRVRRYSATATVSGKAWRPDARTVTTEHTANAVFLGKGFGIEKMMNKDLLARSEMVILVAPLTPAVDISEFNAIEYSGTEYRVEGCDVLKPADQICLFMFGVKR